MSFYFIPGFHLIGITNVARFDHQDSLIHGTSRVMTEEVSSEERFSPGPSGSILSPRGEPLTHLGRVIAERTPRWLPYIHIVRRGINARRTPIAGAHSAIIPRYDYGCGYTKGNVLYAPRHGLFMGYIARFLPPTRVLTPLLRHLFLLLSSLSELTFSFFVLSPLRSFRVRFFFFWTYYHHFSAYVQCEERTLAENALCVVIGSFVLKEFLYIMQNIS